MWNDSAGPAHEGLQQGRLGAGEGLDACASLELAEVGTQYDIFKVHGLGRGQRNASLGGADLGQEHVEREGLGEVVVGAGVEAADDVFHGVAGGDEDGLGLEAVFAQLADDGEAVVARQHDVEQDEIEGRGTTEAERLVTVEGEFDGVALAFERTADVAGEGALVFCDKDVHEL